MGEVAAPGLLAEVADLGVHWVVGVSVQPLTQGPPLRSLVTVPAVFVGEDHLHQVDPRGVEHLEQTGQVGELIGTTAKCRAGRRWRFLAPERLPDQEEPVSADRAAQQVDRACYAATDPGGTEAARNVERTGLANLGAGVALLDQDTVCHGEFGGPAPGGADEHFGEVDTHAADAVFGRPTDEHRVRKTLIDLC